MSHTTAKDRLIVALDMPTLEEAERLVATLNGTVNFYKVGLELLFSGGLELARTLKAQGNHVFLDMKLLDIGNTVERAVANATEFGVDFLTIHGHDLKTLRAAVTGRGNGRLKLLAVTVMTNLTSGDLTQQGSSMSPQDLVLRRAQLAHGRASTALSHPDRKPAVSAMRWGQVFSS
jgi:orotidine-5'-phosphate decarboxylase